MSITVEEWRFVNTFASWFSAFATILAVIVSLYIAYSSRKIYLKITSGIYIYKEEGVDEEYLMINIINTGFRTITLNSYACIYLQVGLFKKTNIGIGWKYIDVNKSSEFPCRLYENEAANLCIKINQDDKDWLLNFKEEYLDRYWVPNLRIVVSPNIGKPFKEKVDKSIKRKLK